ncbi:MAG: glycosyltransferase family 2 protein [Acidimicrobiales bacterium]
MASIIVRARNEEQTIERALCSLRHQTVTVEIVVVDSGSTDRTRAIARRWADVLIDLPADRFTFGRALNVGAAAASAAIHFALSAHCRAERADWIERSLAHYGRADVAGTYGDRALADGQPLNAVFYQDVAYARAHPYWGFTNHASSWRANVWERFPFDERLDAAEDKEWALRVLNAGWIIAVDPLLWVDMSHVWRNGLLDYYRRQKRVARAVRSFQKVSPPYQGRQMLAEWWGQADKDRRSALRRRLSPVRAAGLVGKYQGHR